MSIIFWTEKCPCGSGKKFINCCFRLHHKYQKVYPPAKSITKNKYMVIDETLYDSYISQIKSFLNYHINQDLQTNLKDYGNLLFYIDKIMEMVYPYTDCRKGCEHCCYMTVGMSEFEAEYIKQYINSNWSNKEKKELYSKVKKLKREHTEIFNPTFLLSESCSKTRVPCVFLKDGCCTIYPCRPSICRSYVSLSPSQICHDVLFNSNTKNTVVETNVLNEVREQLLEYFSSQGQHYKLFCALPFWFYGFK